jgi:TRAP-type C4-dicarboxylate transport system permease small subunit
MKKIYERLMEGETYAAAFGFTGSTLLIFVSSIMRSIGHPINWAWDLTLFLFAWSVFLAADSAMRHDKLVMVDLLVNAFPVKMKNILTVVNYLLMLAFLVALVVFGVIMSYTTRSRTFQGMPSFSYTWVTLSIPVGAALLCITVVLKLKDSLKKLAGQG